MTAGVACRRNPRRSNTTLLVNRRLLRPLPWNRPADTQFFHEDWSGWWIVVAIDVIAIASIVGRRPGKLHRAVWLFGLWLVPWLLVEIVRYVFAAREMGPAERFDWSGWCDVSIREVDGFVLPLLLIVAVWWLVRLVRWSVKWIRARMGSSRRVTG